MSLFFCAADSSCFVAISCQKESKNTATNHSLYMDESKNIIFCFVLIIVTSSGGQNTDNKNNIPFGKKNLHGLWSSMPKAAPGIHSLTRKQLFNTSLPKTSLDVTIGKNKETNSRYTNGLCYLILKKYFYKKFFSTTSHAIGLFGQKIEKKHP